MKVVIPILKRKKKKKNLLIMFSLVMIITVVHSAFLIYVSIILICMKINYNIFQVLNFLNRKFESMFSISHDQELMEERLSLSIVKGQMSYSFGLNFLI